MARRSTRSMPRGRWRRRRRGSSSSTRRGTRHPTCMPDSAGRARSPPATVRCPFMNADMLAIYPGSFDPLTNGHVDIIQRGSRLFDRIVVAILLNVEKAPLFTVAERVEIAREVFAEYPNVEVDTFDGLLVEYARRKGAGVIVRGLRAISDFEYELQMALMNRHLNPDVETVFMMPAETYTYVSSRLVKEVVALGGSVTNLVPRLVEDRLRDKKRGRETLRA